MPGLKIPLTNTVLGRNTSAAFWVSNIPDTGTPFTDNMIHCLVDNDNEVTLTVQNPGGTLNLTVNYTLISERPIEPQDVDTEVEEDANYQVAQVRFSWHRILVVLES